MEIGQVTSNDPFLILVTWDIVTNIIWLTILTNFYQNSLLSAYLAHKPHWWSETTSRLYETLLVELLVIAVLLELNIMERPYFWTNFNILTLLGGWIVVAY